MKLPNVKPSSGKIEIAQFLSEDLKSDRVIGEAKTTPMNRVPRHPECARQHPHTGPAMMAAFKQNSFIVTTEDVRFRQRNGRRWGALDGEGGGSWSLAKSSDRADSALGIVPGAHENREIHHSGMKAAGATNGHELAGYLPQVLAACRRVNRLLDVEEPRQDAGSIGFDDWERLSKCKGRDRVGRVPADTRQQLEIRRVSWNLAVEATRDYFRRSMKMMRTTIISQALPGTEYFIPGSTGKGVHIWKLSQPVIIVGNHRSNPRLLQHNLRDHDRIGVARFSPGELPLVFLKPLTKSGVKLPEPGRGQCVQSFSLRDRAHLRQA